MKLQNLHRIASVIEPLLRAARIPGAAIAVVAGGETVFAEGFGVSDLSTRRPMTATTVYPIGSSTKSINATLLALLVEEGLLDWDRPVQNDLPFFRLADPLSTAQVTLRDLVTMRTGLPRHDWVWLHHPITRAELTQRIAHLEFSSSFRERFKYNNLTVAVAGHVAEVVAGQAWESLVQQRLLEPLGMHSTQLSRPADGSVTTSYHEDRNRQLLPTLPRADGQLAPAGTALYSTVQDMARWAAFNLNGGKVEARSLLQASTLQSLHTPQVLTAGDPAAPSTCGTYGLGWFVDAYNGCARVSHSGYMCDVSSEVSLFPEQGIAIVSFINFGGAIQAGLLNEHTFDLLMDLQPIHAVEKKLAQYEQRIIDTRARQAGARKVANTRPSHPLNDYAGAYVNRGYGAIEILRRGEQLVLRRGALNLPLQHWHYDVWVAEDADWFTLQAPHCFDQLSRLLFETNAGGGIASLSIPFESAVPAIRFIRQ